MALRCLALAAVAGLAVVLYGVPAEAHSHSRFVFGFNFGVPCCYYGPRYYAPAYSYYPPPPPVYYAPPPAYYAAPRVIAPAPACRDFHGNATVDGRGTPFYGRACLGADGLWHIVSSY
jgi:hypothetical protein